MITRELKNIQVVPGFHTPGSYAAPALFHSCTVAGFTSACGGPLSTDVGYYAWGGPIIDRLALNDSFNAVAVALNARADITTSVESTAMVKYYGLTIGLQHSSSTAASGFSNLSTGEWVIDYPLQQVSTATSTAAGLYTVEGAGVAASHAGLLSTALSSSTSTGYAVYVGPAPVFSLEAAKRYVRAVVAPHIEVTGCGSPGLSVNGVLVFGYPGSGPASTDAPRGRVQVTSACST